jgi:hypothetical protein
MNSFEVRWSTQNTSCSSLDYDFDVSLRSEYIVVMMTVPWQSVAAEAKEKKIRWII